MATKQNLFLINEHCEARPSPIHGTGLFARRDICKDTRVVEYIGEKIQKDESNRRGLELFEKNKNNGAGLVYIIELNAQFDLDGNNENNHARFINHSCEPNCEAVCEVDERIWIVASRDIGKGEELTYDYGYDLAEFLDHPCRCAAPNCAGYIVRADQRLKLRAILKGRKPAF